MAPIDMRRYDKYTREIISRSARTPQQPHDLLSFDRPMASPAASSDTQTFPILPEQMDKHLELAHQRLAYDIPSRVFCVSGSAPSPSLGDTPVLDPPSPTIYAFQASTLGMPSRADYTRFLIRYLDEMIPNRRGKALIGSELLERIKLTLTFQHNRYFDSGERSGTPYDTGASWDTPPFRRWVRNTFVYRQATQAELERTIDFGLLSPPESSLLGPGVPGYAPSTCLSHFVNLVFHQDRPIAVRSRIYKVILRAHWITNHAGRDKTWAMVQEVCSYIPKRLVYDFVAACPTCRVARSGHYGGKKDSITERGLLPTLSRPPHLGPTKLPPPFVQSHPVISIPHRAVCHPQQPSLQDRDLQETQEEMPIVEPYVRSGG